MLTPHQLVSVMRTINQTVGGIRLTWIISHRCRAMTNVINQDGEYTYEFQKREFKTPVLLVFLIVRLKSSNLIFPI